MHTSKPTFKDVTTVQRHFTKHSFHSTVLLGFLILLLKILLKEDNRKTTGAESWRGESVHRWDTHDRQEQTPQDTGNDCCDTDLRKMNRLSVLKHKHLSPYLTITVFNYYDNILRSCLEGST